MVGWRELAAAAADLAWGGACAACGTPGPVVCPDCESRLRSLAPAAVTVRHGVPPTYARGAYADDLRAVILACKERQGLRLVQLWAFDRASPEFRARLAREAELVRGHESTREANDFLAELWDERLGSGADSAD